MHILGTVLAWGSTVAIACITNYVIVGTDGYGSVPEAASGQMGDTNFEWNAPLVQANEAQPARDLLPASRTNLPRA